MSSVQLLDKTRKIGKLLHNNNSSKVVFNDICKVMRDIVNSNVLVISKKGKVLGVGTCEGVEELKELVEDNVGGFIDPMLNERLLGVLSTKENVILLHWDLRVQMYVSSRQLLLRLRSQESVWEHYLFINAMSSMILMILFCVNTALQL